MFSKQHLILWQHNHINITILLSRKKHHSLAQTWCHTFCTSCLSAVMSQTPSLPSSAVDISLWALVEYTSDFRQPLEVDNKLIWITSLHTKQHHFLHDVTLSWTPLPAKACITGTSTCTHYVLCSRVCYAHVIFMWPYFWKLSFRPNFQNSLCWISVIYMNRWMDLTSFSAVSRGGWKHYVNIFW